MQHLSPDGGRLAARRVLNVSLYDLEDLTTSSVGDSPPFTSMADANVPHRIVYSPDGAISASLAASMIGGRIANSAKGIALHDREGELLHNLQGHSGEVNCGTFSPDGRRFISGGQDGTIRVWDVQNGDLLLTLRGHSGSVDSLAFVRDGRSLVSLSRSDGRVRRRKVEFPRVKGFPSSPGSAYWFSSRTGRTLARRPTASRCIRLRMRRRRLPRPSYARILVPSNGLRRRQAPTASSRRRSSPEDRPG